MYTEAQKRKKTKKTSNTEYCRKALQIVHVFKCC